VTVSRHTHVLPELFIVMATQNPLEQAGTYPLPEAQLDRFLMHVPLGYPDQDEELLILQRDRKTHFGDDVDATETRLTPDTVLRARHEVAEIHIEPALEQYIVQLVHATRDIGKWVSEWRDYVNFGASPRASLALVRSASAYAYLHGRDYVVPDDIIAIAKNVLRHRILLNYTAQANQVSSDDIIDRLIELVPTP